MSTDVGDMQSTNYLSLTAASASHPAWNEVNYRMLAGLINKWAVGPWAWETDPFSQQIPAKKKPQWGKFYK